MFGNTTKMVLCFMYHQTPDISSFTLFNFLLIKKPSNPLKFTANGTIFVILMTNEKWQKNKKKDY